MVARRTHGTKRGHLLRMIRVTVGKDRRGAITQKDAAWPPRDTWSQGGRLDRKQGFGRGLVEGQRAGDSGTYLHDNGTE